MWHWLTTQVFWIKNRIKTYAKILESRYENRTLICAMTGFAEKRVPESGIYMLD